MGRTFSHCNNTDQGKTPALKEKSQNHISNNKQFSDNSEYNDFQKKYSSNHQKYTRKGKSEELGHFRNPMSVRERAMDLIKKYDDGKFIRNMDKLKNKSSNRWVEQIRDKRFKHKYGNYF